MADDSDDSSLDGGLQDFLRQHGIGEFDVSTAGTSLQIGDDFELHTTETSRVGVAVGLQHLVPSVHKVTQMLHSQGFDPLHWSETDVDASQKVSVFVVDGWASSILSCLEELTVRLDTQQSAVKDASLSSRKTEVSTAALETRVQILQDKLLEADRKLKLSEATLAKKEEGISLKARNKKTGEDDSRRVVRGLEEKVEVSFSTPLPPGRCITLLTYPTPPPAGERAAGSAAGFGDRAPQGQAAAYCGEGARRQRPAPGGSIQHLEVVCGVEHLEVVCGVALVL